MPRPWHIWPGVLLLAIGTVSMFNNGWFIFGLIVSLIGAFSSVTTAWAVPVYQYGIYWERVKDAIKVINATNDPEILAHFGFKRPAQQIEIIENTNLEHGQYRTTRFGTLNISPAILQAIADIILSGQGNFSEEEIVNKRKLLPAPKFRELQDEMEQKNILELRNKNNPRQGYAPTPKGTLVLYEAASESVRMMIQGESK